MPRPRWKLSDLLLLVLACGVAFAAYRFFMWPPPDTNGRTYLAAYLSLLTTTSLGSFFARPSWRRSSQGFASFGWCHLIFLMWVCDGLNLRDLGGTIVLGCQMGVVFGVLCAIVAAWLLEPPRGA
jgi:hypothetical protein